MSKSITSEGENKNKPVDKISDKSEANKFNLDLCPSDDEISEVSKICDMRLYVICIVKLNAIICIPLTLCEV